MSEFINLISDTVTKPSPEMLKAMFQAEVGDDVFGEDPTVNRLQQMAADMFGMEAALFCPSGTQTNQIAIAMHTSRLDEVICHEYSHIYQYETGGYAYNSGVGIKLLKGDNGILDIEDVKAAINPTYDWLTNSSLLVLENTSNKGGGSYYTIDQVEEFSKLAQKTELKFHLDGARLFNALVETGESTKDYGRLFDSISICLSKGLGAPVGSLLLGSTDFIKQSRRLRKAMGGGMRQAGYLAAAGIYALENNLERLKVDNDRAKDLGRVLETLNYVESVRPVQTNILIFDLKKPIMAAPFLEKLKEKGINASPFGPSTIRFVTHLDLTEKMIERTKEILKDLENWNF